MLKSVDRPLEVISVNDICKNAGISRQTFYNHFESKYMLRSWWSEYCEQFSLDRIGIDLSWEEASIRYAQLMLSPGNFIFKSASNNRAESEPYEKILVERRVNALRKACSYRNVEIAPDLEYAMHHYAQSFRLCGNEISAAGESSFKGINEISRCFILIVPAILYDALQLPQFKKRSQLENYNLIDSIVWKVLISLCQQYCFERLVGLYSLGAIYSFQSPSLRSLRTLPSKLLSELDAQEKLTNMYEKKF